MTKNKIILAAFAFLLTTPISYAISIDEITEPMQPANRLGIGNTPEKTFAIKTSKKVIKENKLIIE